MQEALFRYWGKADRAYAGEQKWHPLVYHCLDVAAVGVEYLASAAGAPQAIAPPCNCRQKHWR